ncbi:MAG: hypothetical protein U0K57_03640 [Lachnospiraceae bacterium]|nr:hypothetical protein [Lachnospiraceae bacterium]
MKCPNCGSENVEEKVKLCSPYQDEDIGLRYIKPGGLILNYAPVYVNVCPDCGKILDMYISEVPKGSQFK